MINNDVLLQEINSPVRRIGATVDCYSSTPKTVDGETIIIKDALKPNEELDIQLSSKNLFTTNNNVGANQNLNIEFTSSNSFKMTGKSDKWSASSTYDILNIKSCDYITISFNYTDNVVDKHLDERPNELLIWQNGEIKWLYKLGTNNANNQHRYSFATGIKEDFDLRIGFYARVNDGETFEDYSAEVTDIQVERSNEMTDFTPFISDFSTVEVTACGRNLFDTNTYADGMLKGNANAEIVEFEGRRCIKFPGAKGEFNYRGTSPILKAPGRYISWDAYSEIQTSSFMGYHFDNGGLVYSHATQDINNWTLEYEYTDKNIVKIQPYVWLNTADKITYVDLDKLFVSAEKCDIEPYDGKTVFANADGTVDGLVTRLDYLTLSAMNSGAIIEVTYNAKVLDNTFNSKDRLISFDIEKTGEGKFFGYGVSQKQNIKLIDTKRELNISTNNYFINNINGVKVSPQFYVTQVRRDENNNELSITAYDTLYFASTAYVGQLTLPEAYTIKEFADICASALGVNAVFDIPANDDTFELNFENGANFEGSETIREALDDIAEVTQTIYYINADNELVFKRLDKDGEAVLTIDKDKYITLSSKENRRLAKIVKSTELGDNVSVSTSASGSTQYIHENAFWDLRDDIDVLLDKALTAVGGFTINQFSCSWRGNPLLEIGDKIELITKANESVYSYLLNDTLSYNGGLEQSTQWEYDENDTESDSNPNDLGALLKQTYAKVDKANKQVDIVVSNMENVSGEVNGVKEQMSSLQLTTNTINANVTQLQESNKEAIDNIYANMDELTQSVNMAITSENVAIEVEKQLANGVNSVTTSTGFTFDEQGLTVSKSDSEISTSITDDGMKIYLNDEAVLTANNQGVDAYNLHATTYLIVGKYSRFEDFGERTGCFWIGEAGYTPADTATLDEITNIAILDENGVI